MQITSALSNLHSWLTYGNRSKWLVFFLFALTLFVKTMIFHWTTMHSILFSSLWKAPLSFFAFWGGKIIPVLFLSAFVFLAKRQYWTIVINLLLDIWCIANLYYFKANGLFLSFDMIFMVNNMDGFWDSLRAYFGWEIIMLPFITVIYTILVSSIKRYLTTNKVLSITTLLTLLSILFACMNNYLDQKAVHYTWKQQNQTTIGQWMEKHTTVQYKYCIPFAIVYRSAIENVWIDDYRWEVDYIKTKSIIAYFFAILVDKSLEIVNTSNIENIKLLESDKAILKNFVHQDKHIDSQLQYPSNLIYILVESLESWPLNSVEYLSNLVNLIHQDNVCFVDNVSSQVLHGNSADGQMIGMTGLLPISNGATCKLYGKNKFPNFAHMYSNSAIINPSKGVWQQETMTKSYEFKELLEPEDGEHWNDEDVLNKVLDFSFKNTSSFCVLGITITSHVPFVYGAINQKYTFENMPNLMSAYLNCLHYTDSCIGVLVDSILNSPLANNTTIVITGDHTIFRNANTFSDMTEYARANDINFQAGKTFTPLIIYSPNIQGNIHVTDTCYQMDIFPTILHLIGAEDYYWKGLGVNLLDSIARNNRPITEQEAYRLSDLMIRSDYFRHYCADTDSTNIAEYYL